MVRRLPLLTWRTESDLEDAQQTDGMLASAAIQRLANFSRDGIGRPGANKPWFHAVGFHKPHLPHIVPQRYFNLYDADNISVAPNKRVPDGFREENFHADGTFELVEYDNAGPVFRADHQGFTTPVDDAFARKVRHGYYAASSFIDAQVGRVLAALEASGFKDNTIVVLWSDHGWHLGDTGSWCKMTNFESAARATLMWRVPGQPLASQGRNERLVEMLDLFPTLIDLAGLPAIPQCQGLDQPPSKQCVQGTSYAELFAPASHRAAGPPRAGKLYAFTQWPFPPWGNETALRMGYTVRSADGYRLTEYVTYNLRVFRGEWKQGVGDLELYDYNRDPWETQNHAGNSTYGPVVARLRAVLRQQYAPELASV